MWRRKREVVVRSSENETGWGRSTLAETVTYPVTYLSFLSPRITHSNLQAPHASSTALVTPIMWRCPLKQPQRHTISLHAAPPSALISPLLQPPCCSLQNMSVQDTQSADRISFEAIHSYEWADDQAFQVNLTHSLPINYKDHPLGRVRHRSELFSRLVCSPSYHQQLPRSRLPC